MTKLTNNQEQSFLKLKNWKEMFEWHQLNSPWLENTQIREILIFYHKKATKIND